MRGRPVEQDDGIAVETRTAGDGGLVSTATSAGLRPSHSGKWTCRRLVADGGEEVDSKSLDVLVVGSSTRLCRPRETSTSRGRYSWGSAVGGHTVQQACRAPKDGAGFAGFAFRLCRESGQWAANVNTSQCGYTSRVSEALLLRHDLCFHRSNCIFLRPCGNPVIRVCP